MSEPVTLHGFEELQRALAKQLGAPKAAALLLDSWRFNVERGAKANIKRGIGGWLWKGGDRRSITSERDHSSFPTWARVGSNSKTIRFGEFGTGRLSEDPQSSHRRYFPPPAALDEWAIQHGYRTGTLAAARKDTAASPGTYGYLVARAIWIAGGTKPRRFLRDAAKESQSKLPGWLAQAAAKLEAEAGRGA